MSLAGYPTSSFQTAGFWALIIYGSYGEQAGDSTATITPQEQRAQTVGASVEMVG